LSAVAIAIDAVLHLDETGFGRRVEFGEFDDGARMVTFPVQKDTKTMPGARYLYTRVFPNVFFHCATTYNILRHNGVEIGKGDFLGPIKD
jgi:hypothetical protein